MAFGRMAACIIIVQTMNGRNLIPMIAQVFCLLMHVISRLAIVKRRADKLKVDYCFLGVKNKMQIVNQLISDLGISLSEVAYIGDDINDLAVLRSVGTSGVPSSAPFYMKSYGNITLSKKGGEGVFREFVEAILGEEKILSIIDNVVLANQ